MKKDALIKDQLHQENEEMRIRLEKAEDLIRALQNGEVDAFVVAKGSESETIPLEGADFTYRAMVDLMNEGSLTLIPDGTIYLCNPCFSEMVQRPSEELVGTLFSELILQSERSKFETALKTSKKMNIRKKFHLDVPPLEKLSVQLSISHIKTDEMLGYLVIVTDLTGQEQSEKALFQSKSILKSFYESVPMLMGVVELTDEDEIIHIYDNPATEEFFTVDPGVLSGKSAREMQTSEEVIQKWVVAYHESNQLQKSVEFEYIHPTQYGPRWLLATVSPLEKRHSVNNKMRFSYVAQDITDRKESEAKIASLAKFPSENPHPIIRVDTNCIIQYANKSSEPILKSWKTQVGKAISKNWVGGIEEVKASNQIKSTEIQVGEQVFACTISPIVNQDYINLYFNDITERKKAEDESILRLNQLSIAREIGKTLTETMDLDQIYERLYGSLIEILPDSDTMFISLFDEVKRDFHCVFAASENTRYDPTKLPRTPLLAPGKGIQSEIFYNQLPILVDNLPALVNNLDIATYIVENSKNAQSGLYLPMLANGKLVGVVITESKKLNRYSQVDAEMFSLIANTAAIAICNARLFGQTEKDLRKIKTLHDIDEAISNNLNPEITFSKIEDIIVSSLEVHAVNILVLNKKSNILESKSRYGFRTQALLYTRLPIGQGLAGQVALEREIKIIQDLAANGNGLLKHSESLPNEGFLTYIGVPLLAKDEIVGVLEIFHRDVLKPDQEWLNFLETLAQQAAIAIDNTLLFTSLELSNKELSGAYEATILGWSSALDLRDKETEGHSHRVNALTLKLASRMHFTDEELVPIRHGALLHDIGKMGIEDQILHKPGPLTDEEWVLMRSHPKIALDLLYPISFLQKAIDIPYCHHEKWDGSGYPRGLKGEDIPLSARIFAVVDVWDALTSDRPYRKAWTNTKALNYIKEQSGKHFDPNVVKEFMQLDFIKKAKEGFGTAFIKA